MDMKIAEIREIKHEMNWQERIQKQKLCQL